MTAPTWDAANRRQSRGCVAIRFAVFEFPRNSNGLLRRAELERTIRFFAENFAQYESVDDLVQEMVSQGFDPDLVDETESFATIAFGRALLEHLGVRYPATVIRVRRDGQVETDVPLMSIPAYTRAWALAVRLRETMPQDDFQALGLYNAESQVILQAMEAGGGSLDLTQVELRPCVVPERGVSAQTMDAVLADLGYLVGESHPPQASPGSDAFDVLDQIPAAGARSLRPFLSNTWKLSSLAAVVLILAGAIVWHISPGSVLLALLLLVLGVVTAVVSMRHHTR